MPIELVKKYYSPYSYVNFMWKGYGIDRELFPNDVTNIYNGYDAIVLQRINAHKGEIRAMFWDLAARNKWIVLKDLVLTRTFIWSLWGDSAGIANFNMGINHGTFLAIILIIMRRLIIKKGWNPAILAPFAVVLLNTLSAAVSLTPEVRYLWITFIAFPFYIGMLYAEASQMPSK